jgi:hypothetical protein
MKKTPPANVLYVRSLNFPATCRWMEEAPRKHQRIFRVFQQTSRNISACENFSSKQQVLLCQLIGFYEKTQQRTEEQSQDQRSLLSFLDQLLHIQEIQQVQDRDCKTNYNDWLD